MASLLVALCPLRLCLLGFDFRVSISVVAFSLFSQVPMPLPFGVDRDSVRETAMLCNNVQPYYGASNLARHIKKIHPELYAREKSDMMSRRGYVATPDSAGGTPMDVKALISPLDMGARLTPPIAVNFSDRDGSSSLVPGFEPKLAIPMAAHERRIGLAKAGGDGEHIEGDEYKAKLKSRDQLEHGNSGADSVIHASPYSPALATRQLYGLSPTLAESESDLVPSLFGARNVTKRAAETERRCVLWCIQGLHPWHILSENKGLAWVPGLAPGAADGPATLPWKSAYERVLQEEYDRGRERVLAELGAMRAWIKVGSFAHLIVQSVSGDSHTRWLTLSLAFLNRQFELRVLNLETMVVDVSTESPEEVSDRIRDKVFQWLAPVIQSDLNEAVSAVVLEKIDSDSSATSKFLPSEEALRETLRVPVASSLADMFDTMMQQALDSVINLSSDSLSKTRKHDHISSTVLLALSLVERLCRCKKSENTMDVIHHDIAQIGAVTGLANVDEEVVLKRIAERLEQPLRPSKTFPQPNWVMVYLVLDRMLCLESSIGTLTASDADLNRDCASLDFAVCREVASALDPFAEFRTIARGLPSNTMPRICTMMKELVAYCDGDQADIRSPTYSDQQRTVVSKNTLSSTVVSLFDAIQGQVKMHQSGEQFKDYLKFQRLATFFDVWYRDEELDDSSLATSKAEVDEELRQIRSAESPQTDAKKSAPETQEVGRKVSGSFFERRQRHPHQQRQQQHSQQAATPSNDSGSKETDYYMRINLSLEDEASYDCGKWWSERVGGTEGADGSVDTDRQNYKKSLPQLARLAARHGAYRASYDQEADLAALASRLHTMHQSACLDHVNKAFFVRSCRARDQKDEAVVTK